MKVQVVERECTAKVGVSVEFSNSEIDSIVRLALSLDDAIEKGCKTSASIAKAANKPYGLSDKIPVAVDLKHLVRIAYLLDKITDSRVHNTSGLFNDADVTYGSVLESINNQGEE